MYQKVKIILFLGDNLVGHLIAARILQLLDVLCIEPIIFITKGFVSQKSKSSTFSSYSFYDRDLLHSTVYKSDYKGFGKEQKNFFKTMMEKYTVHKVTSLSDPIVSTHCADRSVIGALSVRNFHIFSPELISMLSSKGFFWNLHQGTLPEHRGLFLPFWSMLEGKTRHGCTLHEIDAGIDTGNIIDVFETDLDRSKPVIQSYVDLVDGGAGMIKKALTTYLATGSVPTTTQDMSKARYYSFPTEDDIARARAQGIRLWGSPMEMLTMYQELFGYDELLSMRIINAIAEFEQAQENAAEEVRAAQITAA